MTPPPKPTTPRGGRDALGAFAETIETTFLESGHSLTQPETAHIYLTTLALVGRLLEGFQANDVISLDQLRELAAGIEGMRQAPRLV